MADRITKKQLEEQVAALQAELASLKAAASPAPSTSETNDEFVPTAETPFRRNYFFHLVGCAARGEHNEIGRAMAEVRTKFDNAAAVRLHSKIYAFAKKGSAQKSQS
jgi:hypothetical protein